MALRHVRHLPAQLPVVAALGSALLRRRASSTAAGTIAPPHPTGASTAAGTIAPHPTGASTVEVVRTIAPPHRALVRDYIEHVGGEPAAYRETLPAHFFPHWCVPLAARTLDGLPYPLTRIVNAGCRLEIRGPLPQGAPLIARASRIAVEDDGRRATITQRLVTGTRDAPELVVATLYTVVPLRGRAVARDASKTSATTSLTTTGGIKERATVPYDAHELARWTLAGDAGLAFAVLTGDFNPIHWLTRAGVAAGFGGPILHGFAMFARAIEGVVRARFAGEASRVRVWDAKFTRPLRLPADVGLYSRGAEVWIGDAPGTKPYLVMTMEESALIDRHRVEPVDERQHAEVVARIGTDATGALP